MIKQREAAAGVGRECLDCSSSWARYLCLHVCVLQTICIYLQFCSDGCVHACEDDMLVLTIRPTADDVDTVPLVAAVGLPITWRASTTEFRALVVT